MWNVSIDCIHWRPNENRRKRRGKNVPSSSGRQLICPSSVYCCKCQVLKELLQQTLGLQRARECVIFHTPLLSRWEGPVDFHSGERRFTFSSHTPSVPYEFSSVSVTLTKAYVLSQSAVENSCEDTPGKCLSNVQNWKEM